MLLINCSKEKISEKKQIILISIDTLRADNLTSSGYFRDTSPHLSKLVEDSVYYIHAYTNGCWTMPGHMSLFTGTLPSRHGINKDWKSTVVDKKYPKLNDSIKSISEVLKSHNIKTVKFAKLPDELGFNRGFDLNNPVDPFSDNKKMNELLKELENNKEEDFFLFIHTWMVHAPYANSYFLKETRIEKEKREYINNFRKIQKKRLSAVFYNFLKENNLNNVHDCVALYDGGIRYVDQCIGKIINKSKQLGMYDDLLFIVVSDHGEHFGEHSHNFFYNYHGRDYYEEFIKVPLIIKYPYTFKRKIINHPVSLIDVFPTILDYYKIKIPSYVQGESLLKPNSKRKAKYIISEAVSDGNIEKKMIIIGDLKYIITMRNPSKPERVNWDSISERRLFDLKNDPLEQSNLYTDLKFRRVCINFEKMIFKIIKNSSKTNRSIKKTTVNKETIKHLEALGYL
jgi:arylsulfatase A-like enzyme